MFKSCIFPTGIHIPTSLNFFAASKKETATRFTVFNPAAIENLPNPWIKQALKIAAFSALVIATVAIVGAIMNPVGITFSASVIAALTTYKMVLLPFAYLGSFALLTIPLVMLKDTLELNAQHAKRNQQNKTMIDGMIAFCKSDKLKQMLPHVDTVRELPSNEFHIEMNQETVNRLLASNIKRKTIKTKSLSESLVSHQQEIQEFIDKLDYGLAKIPIQFLKDNITRSSLISQASLPNGKSIDIGPDSTEPQTKIQKVLELTHEIHKYVKEAFPGKGRQNTILRNNIRDILFYYFSQEFYNSVAQGITAPFQAKLIETIKGSASHKPKFKPISISIDRVDTGADGPITFKANLKMKAIFENPCDLSSEPPLFEIDCEANEQFEISPNQDQEFATQNDRFEVTKAIVKFY